MHTVAEDKAIELCLAYAENPNLLKNAVLLWAVTLSDDDFARLVADLILEKDSIQNSQFEIDNEPEEEADKGKKKSVIKRIYQSLSGLWRMLQKILGGKKSQSGEWALPKY